MDYVLESSYRESQKASEHGHPEARQICKEQVKGTKWMPVEAS